VRRSRISQAPRVLSFLDSLYQQGYVVCSKRPWSLSDRCRNDCYEPPQINESKVSFLGRSVRLCYYGSECRKERERARRSTESSRLCHGQPILGNHRWMGLSGNRNANGSGSISGSGYEAGGARPQTAEIIKTFNQRCPEITITNVVQRADFAVTLDHEGGKGYLRRRNKIVVFNREGDAIFSDSTRELGSSVADGCHAIRSSPSKPAPAVSVTPQPQPIALPRSDTSVRGVSSTQPTDNAELKIASNPAGADIQLDGSFVGNTPSTVGVAAGDHTIAINKNGYQLRERKIKVNGGKISVVAELEPEEEANVSKQKTQVAVALTSATPPAPSHNTATSPPETLVVIYLVSYPDGAAINIDDAAVGKAPMTLKLKPGTLSTCDQHSTGEEILVKK
jgi:hypothetical protein